MIWYVNSIIGSVYGWETILLLLWNIPIAPSRWHHADIPERWSCYLYRPCHAYSLRSVKYCRILSECLHSFIYVLSNWADVHFTNGIYKYRWPLSIASHESKLQHVVYLSESLSNICNCESATSYDSIIQIVNKGIYYYPCIYSMMFQ